VLFHVPLAGSYNSALSVGQPPAARTFPLGSSVAVWKLRATLRLPVTLHVSVAESYNSALLIPSG
jgi:hypothetical protein